MGLAGKKWRSLIGDDTPSGLTGDVEQDRFSPSITPCPDHYGTTKIMDA
jgi:hypothetical protein